VLSFHHAVTIPVSAVSRIELFVCAKNKETFIQGMCPQSTAGTKLHCSPSGAHVKCDCGNFHPSI